ncbi:MAG: hypothetical protein ACFB13_22300 [Kiloniellaceae bacterium]
MFGSYSVEFAVGLIVLCTAGALWVYLLRAFQRTPLPALLRPAMAAELSAVLEIALLAFGLAALIDGAAKFAV